MNPELKKDDRVILIKMSDPYSPVPPMTGGVVMSSSKVFGDILYYVNWDNGQKLNLISGEDIWMLEEDFNRKRNKKNESIVLTKKQIVKEGGEQQIDTAFKNRQIIKNYSFKKLLKFLASIRATGIINMFQAGYFLTCGKELLEHFIKYKDIRNKNAVKYALDNAEEIRTLMIGGAIKMVENDGQEVTPESVQRRMKRDTQKIMELYMSFPITNEFDNSDEDYDDEEEEDDNY